MTTRVDPIKEAAAAKAIRESLAAMGEHDEGLALDMIEGETSLLEIIDALLLRIAENDGQGQGLGAMIDTLEARRRRFANRIKTDRALIEQAMMIAEMEKLERPVATLSLTRRAPKVEITTEAEIPAQFWKAGDPTLDKKALAAALKDGPVPGAVLTNAAPSLTVRNL